MLVRHEDILTNTEGWLSMLRTKYGLRVKPAFPVQVSIYKGEQKDEVRPYVHHSEMVLLHQGNGSSMYWNDAALKFMLANLDWQLEDILGYEYGLGEPMQ